VRYRAGGYHLARVAFGYLARLAIPAAAVLMPTGFFLSSMDDGATEPNGLVVLRWLRAAAPAGSEAAAGRVGGRAVSRGPRSDERLSGG
jgi:hypothetical protein